MKNIYITIMVFVLFSIGIKAQENKKGIFLSGGFGGPYASFTTFRGNLSLSLGGGGAMLLNNNYYIGGFGQGTSDMLSVKSDMPDYSNSYIQTEYGGLWIGYILRKNKKFDVDFSIKTAWGEVLLNDKTTRQILYDKVFVLIPEISINFRLGSIMKIQFFGNYTAFSTVTLLDYTEKDFSNPAYGLKLSFGWF